MGRSALAAAVAVVALVAPATWAAAQPATQVASIAVDRVSGSVGETANVKGTNWKPGGLVQVEICGNNGLNGSPDCAVAEGATVVAASDGTWMTGLLVWTPPKPCPCLVRARSVDSDTSVSKSLTIQGATNAPPNLDGKSPAGANASLVVSDVHLDGRRSIWSWFGVPGRQAVVLTVTNSGGTDAHSVVARVTTTSSGGQIPKLTIDTLASGGSRTIRFDIPVSSLTVGNYTVSGDVGGVGFSTRGSTYPWALLAVALVLVEVAAWRGFKWISSRLARRSAGEAAGAGAPVPEGLPPPPPAILAFVAEPEPVAVEVVAVAEPEPVVVEGPVPVTVAEPEPEPEPVVAAEPLAESEGEDRPVPVPEPEPEPEAEAERVVAEGPDWEAVGADLAAAVQPAVKRLLDSGGPVTYGQIEYEAEVALAPIVEAHHLDPDTAAALCLTLADELTKLPVLHPSC